MTLGVWIFLGVGLGVGMVGLVGLGIWLGWRQSRRCQPPPFWPAAQARQLAQLAQGLTGLVHSVAKDVDEHQTQIQQANEGLRSLSLGGNIRPEEQPSAWAALVLRTVAEIVQVNQRLQHRLQQAEEKLHQQAQQIQTHLAEARTDPLTGLPNRRAFDDELLRRLAEWQRKGAVFCLLLVDVDHFKEVNDQYGHPIGDHLLRQLAEVLLTAVREMDLVARIGGEEFAILLPSTNLPDGLRVAQRLRAAVADSPLEIAPGQTGKLTISIGITPVRPGDHPQLLLRRADQALYTAKRAGRNCGFYHDGQTCRAIPFCSPPNRPWTVPPEWPAASEEQTGSGTPGQPSCLPGQNLPEPDLAPLADAQADPGETDPWADPAGFQTACEALRDQLAALTEPGHPTSELRSET